MTVTRAQHREEKWSACKISAAANDKIVYRPWRFEERMIPANSFGHTQRKEEWMHSIQPNIRSCALAILSPGLMRRRLAATPFSG
jgi:hypothetical protein